MVKEEACCSFGFAIKCGHGLCPLSEVIDYHNDVFMTISQNWVDCHEVNCPFAEGPDYDYGVQWCKGSSCLWGKELTAVTMLDCLYAISKDGRPEVAGT